MLTSSDGTNGGNFQFWLFPPHGKSDEARIERATMLKDIVENAIASGRLSLDDAPGYGDVEVIADLADEMVRSTGHFDGADGAWRDEGLCLAAIAAEGHLPSRILLALETAREIGDAKARRVGYRLLPHWLRSLERRVCDLLSGQDILLPHPMPHADPLPDSMGVEGMWLSRRKPDARLLHDLVLPYVESLLGECGEAMDGELKAALGKIVQTRGCQPGPYRAAASLFALGRGDGTVYSSLGAARLLHFAGASLGDKPSMLAMVEYLLAEAERHDRRHDAEALYALAHGWWRLAGTEFRRFPLGNVNEPIRKLAATVCDLSHGPLSPHVVPDDYHRAAAEGLKGTEGEPDPWEGFWDPDSWSATPSTGGQPEGGPSRISLGRFNRNDDGEDEDDDRDEVEDAEDGRFSCVSAGKPKSRKEETVCRQREARAALDAKRRAAAQAAAATAGHDGPAVRMVRDLSGAIRSVQEAFQCLLEPLPLVSAPDPERVRTILTLEFPWMRPVIDMICDDLWSRRSFGDPTARFRPILIHGKAGIGKTTFAKRLAAVIGTPSLVIPAAGASNNMFLKGLAKGYHSAHPSGLVEFCARRRVANPVAIVDEVDKVGDGTANGNLVHTLLDMLEPRTAKAWLDECLCAEVRLDFVSWVLTANDRSRIPGPLLSRVRCFEVEAPKLEHFDALLTGIRGELAAEYGVRREMLPAFDEVEVEVLRRSFTQHRSVRSLRAKVERLIGLRARHAPVGAVLN